MKTEILLSLSPINREDIFTKEYNFFERLIEIFIFLNGINGLGDIVIIVALRGH